MSAIVWTTASEGYTPVNIMGVSLRKPLDRYAFGACERGLPWRNSSRTECSGDCHPER